MPQALELADAGMIPGGAGSNREFVCDHVTIAKNVQDNLKAVLYDPQTSGGLLIAIPESDATAFAEELERSNQFGWMVGVIEQYSDHRIVVD